MKYLTAKKAREQMIERMIINKGNPEIIEILKSFKNNEYMKEVFEILDKRK